MCLPKAVNETLSLAIRNFTPPTTDFYQVCNDVLYSHWRRCRRVCRSRTTVLVAHPASPSLAIGKRVSAKPWPLRKQYSMAEDVLSRTWAAINKEGPDPSRTFEEAELILPNYLTGKLHEKRVALMRRLTAELLNGNAAQYIAALVNLLIKLFDGWNWQQVCDFEQDIPYKDGLAFGEYMVPFNKLVLCLLEKASLSAADAAHAASMLETMQALVRLWLCTSDTGVSTQAGQLLLDLLSIDVVPAEPLEGVPGSGQGLVWKRIFGDRDVYEIFFETCSLGSGSGLSKNQTTIAQARLLVWLPKVGALNWGAVSRSHHVDIEAKHGVEGGLLDFAALKMVDYKDDVLMYICLVAFFTDVLHATRPLETVCTLTFH